jgi:iron complex outermembrane receptor protein
MHNSSRARWRFAAAGFALAAFGPTQINAQAVAPAIETEKAAPGSSLDEILVTAQKREERLLDVPVSVTALNVSTFAEQNILQIQDYLARVPGLAENVSESGRVSLAIRGITTGTATNATVGVTIDDVPIGTVVGTSYGPVLVPELDPSILERIEVLRGPQGTLYGASSLGGLLKYVTVAPKLDQTNGRVEVDGNAVDHGGDGYGVRGYANVPIIADSLAANMSGFYRRDPGYVDDPQQHRNNVNSDEQYGGRLSALWKMSDAAALRISALLQQVHGFGSSEINSGDSLTPVNGEFTQTRIPATGRYERKLQLYDASLNVDLGWADLTSVTGYQRSDFTSVEDQGIGLGFLTFYATGSNDYGTNATITGDTSKFTQEIRLASKGVNRLDWRVGGFFTHESSYGAYDIVATDLTSGAYVADVLPDHYPQIFREYAGFGDVTYHVTRQFDVQIGGRYSANHQTYHETITGPLYPPPYTYLADATTDGHAFTYLVTPQYRFSENFNVYARIASGYRPGGPNPGAAFGFPKEFAPDKTKSYDLGAKGEFFNHRLSFDLSTYYIDWSGIQLLQIDPATQFSYYTNAGKASSRGVELAAAVAPAAGLEITGTLAYTDATLSDDAGGTIVASAGDRLPFSAKWTASLIANQRFNITSAVSGFIGAGVSYIGSRFQAFQSAGAIVPRLELPAYTTVDAHTGFAAGGWTITLYARNLTDRLGILSAAPESTTELGTNRIDIIRPRTLGVSLVKDF